MRSTITHPAAREARFASRDATGAISAQVSQAGASLLLQILAARALGLEAFGAFAILYGVIVLATGITSGFVGDSLTVLDRHRRSIRSALQGWTLVLSVTAGVVGGAVVGATGLAGSGAAVVFGIATTLFLVEDVLRRLLMAQMRFWRIVLVDFTALAGSLAALGVLGAIGPLRLDSFLGSLAFGQFVALTAAIIVQPRTERYVVGFTFGGYRTVFAYGSWRAAQQALRPGLLTALRAIVLIVAGFAATGQLEAARIYVAPAMLFVSGLSSFLFASYARSPERSMGSLLHMADRGVFALSCVTVAVGGSSILILPLAGKLITGDELDFWTVVGWVAYTASVATVTPYGALAAVRGRQAAVFGLRVADSVLSLGLVAALIGFGGSIAFVPFALAIGSFLGGIAIRWFLLRPTSVAERRNEATPGFASREPIHISE